MIEIKINCHTVPIDSLRANSWNPNEQGDFMRERLNRSLKKFGQCAEVICREAEDGVLEIIDGEHRWVEAKAAGATQIEVNNLGKVPADKARLLTMVMNELHGDRNPLKLSQLLNDLKNDLAWEAYEPILPFSALEMKNLLDMAGEGDAPPFEKKGSDGGDGGKWVDLKVMVDGDHLGEVLDMIELAKRSLKIEKRPDQALENGALLKSLVLGE